MTDPIRAVLDAIPYGLYAIGVADGGGRNAFTANWFTQGGVAWLVCALERTVEAGDHTLLVGRVTDGGLRGPDDAPSGDAGRDGADDAGPAEPLTLHNAGFRYG